MGGLDGWMDGWKSPGGPRYRAPYGANNWRKVSWINWTDWVNLIDRLD